MQQFPAGAIAGRPRFRRAIVAYASNGKLLDARHRAVMIAEREAIGDRIARVDSWILDLQQVSSCEERKVTIEKLVAAADRRALPTLKRAKTIKCLERDATDAIARLEGTN